MTEVSNHPRTDAGARVIKASPQTIFMALVDPKAVAKWRPPTGMTGQVHAFDPRPGGIYRMSLTYEDPNHAVPGKSSTNTDVVEGRFVEIVPDRQVVEAVVFASDNPAYAGEMTITTSLAPAPGGTEVTIECRNVPPGIRQSDHLAGIDSTLENLAAFTE